MYLLVDHLIRNYAGTGLIFDFAGSDMPGVAYFNQGFGSELRQYPVFYKAILPWPFKKLKKQPTR